LEIALTTCDGVWLPRRRCSRANADDGFLTVRDGDERRLNLYRGRAQRVNHAEHEGRRDVSRPQVNDSDKRLARADGGAAETEVMCEDDASLVSRTFENLNVRSTNQVLFPRGAQIAAARSEAFNDVWTDVLVCQEGEIERFHAVMLSSHVRSPFSTSAAY